LGRKEEQEIGSKRANTRKIRAGRERESISIRGESGRLGAKEHRKRRMGAGYRNRRSR
jgi:hypothetical protein